MSDVSDLVVAYRYATKSPDPSTQNGAVLRTRAGRLYKTTAACNDFPKGLSIVAERLQRPLKYSFIEHAERNAIYAAARLGLWADGLEMVATWAACADCARAIVQAGIVRLIRHNPPIDEAGGAFTPKDADLIAHAPTDLRALLAAVRRGRRIEAELDAGYRLVAKPIPDLHDEGCDGG